jgi:hypothetical protein
MEKSADPRAGDVGGGGLLSPSYFGLYGGGVRVAVYLLCAFATVDKAKRTIAAAAKAADLPSLTAIFQVCGSNPGQGGKVGSFWQRVSLHVDT